MDFLQLIKIAHELNANARKHIKSSNFALPGGRYPIEDIAHARNALARAAQMVKKGYLSQQEYQTVLRKVYAKYPSLRK